MLSSTTIFNSITNPYIARKELLRLDRSNNYDHSYCYDKEDLLVWDKFSTSDDLRIQEFHAIFLGLCEKVKRKNLTTEAAQYIFEETRTRLFGK